VFILFACIIGYFFSGVVGILSYFAAKLLGFFIWFISEGIYSKYAYKKYGRPFTGSERRFFQIYDFYAFKLGISSDTRLTEDEVNQQSWKESFNHLKKNWPRVVMRFT